MPALPCRSPGKALRLSDLLRSEWIETPVRRMTENRKSGDGSAVPLAVVSRLSLYLRELQQLVLSGSETTSSTQLGLVLGFTDAQVRKDLAYFGQFGYPGLGYRCEELISEIKRILGTDRRWPVGIVGIGNLGQALLGYS